MSQSRSTELLESIALDMSTVAGDYQTYVDEVDTNTTYIGESLAGTLPAAAAWRIKKVLVTGAITTVKYASGVTTFTKVWNDRVGYVY